MNFYIIVVILLSFDGFIRYTRVRTLQREVDGLSASVSALRTECGLALSRLDFYRNALREQKIVVDNLNSRVYQREQSARLRDHDDIEQFYPLELPNVAQEVGLVPIH